MIKHFLRAFLMFCVTLQVSAGEPLTAEEEASFMLVVRTSFGANKKDEKLVPTGSQTLRDPTGKAHTINMAHFEYLGDTHIRFVFDAEHTMSNANTEQFDALGLTPSEAVDLAISNIHKSYGYPKVFELEGGGYQVRGESPDFDSSYFLDKALWRQVTTHFEEGVVVAVPSRDLLLFAALSNKQAVKFLKGNVENWYRESESQGVSSALFVHENGKWSVYQAPVQGP